MYLNCFYYEILSVKKSLFIEIELLYSAGPAQGIEFTKHLTDPRAAHYAIDICCSGQPEITFRPPVILRSWRL